jgi:hypothetical protein
MHVVLQKKYCRSKPLLNLLQLQTQFQQYLLNEDLAIESCVISTPTVPAITRLQVYKDAYFLRLLEVLESDYPILKNIMGNERFEQLIADYIHCYPSAYRSVRWVGQHLANYIDKEPAFADTPWLKEIALFEWALNDAFDSADKPPLGLESMATISPLDWPNLSFTIHPSVQRWDSEYDIIPLWHAAKNEMPLPIAKAVKSPILVWRKEYDVKFQLMSVDAALMLDTLIAGKTFSSACENLCTLIDEENVAMHAASLLKRFIIDHLLIDVKIAIE